VGPHRIWLGRTRELAELEAGLGELASRRGSLYLLTGEPGIGKSRLADELARVATARGVAVHWGRAWEVGGAPAYWPFIQIVRSIAQTPDPWPALVAPARTPIERFQLFDTVAAFLRDHCRTPRLLVLDDLHAADPSSLELLDFLVRELRELPLMIIGTYRDAEARLSPDKTQLLARIAREGSILPLRRFDRGEVSAFVAAATGQPPDDERAAVLYRQTEGNPLFLRELLRLHGSVARTTEGIQEIVRARLALLEPPARALLEAAAVIGREFGVTPLAAIAEVSELEVRSLVEPAANAAIVEPLDQPPRWRFTHVLLRQGLYDDLADARRRELHVRAAAELERRHKPELAAIAHHLVHAVPHVPAVRAARCTLQAADHAIAELAFEDARELYRIAERLLVDEPAELRFEAIFGSAHACMRMAEVTQGLADCERAAELARELDDGERFARAILMSTYELVPDIRDERVIGSLEEALARLPTGASSLRARCMAQLAGRRHPEPDNASRIALAREAVAMARRLDDPQALLLTLVGASIAMIVYAPPREVLALDQELLRLALAAGDKRIALRTHMFLAGTYYQLGELAGAEAHETAVRELLADFGHGRFAWVNATLGVMRAIVLGRFEQARRDLRAAELAADSDQARGALFAAAPLTLACVTEHYEDRAQVEARTRARFGALPYPLASCIGEMLIAKLHGRAGDRERAEAQLAIVKAHPLFSAIEEPGWLAFLVDATCLVGDRALAERLYATLSPCPDQFGFLGPLTLCPEPPHARHLGLLARALDRIDDAIAHLEHAEARTRQAGMRAHLARLGFELAEALIARGRPEDRDRASRLVADARALAVELEQVGLLPQLAEQPAPVTFASPAFSIRRDGELWLVGCGDREIRLRDTRGMQVLARLVAEPDHELHVLQLVAGEGSIDGGDAGPVLDQVALGRYRRRLLELREELGEAEANCDLGRTDKARTEIEMLTTELARAVGLGGRERRVGGAAERARTAIQKRLRDAIRKIADELPELGRHLEQTIYTGTFCGYLPGGRRR
jgi:hypothetical protein